MWNDIIFSNSTCTFSYLLFFIQWKCIKLAVQHEITLGTQYPYLVPTFNEKKLVTPHISLRACDSLCSTFVLQGILQMLTCVASPPSPWLESPTLSSFLDRQNLSTWASPPAHELSRRQNNHTPGLYHEASCI